MMLMGGPIFLVLQHARIAPLARFRLFAFIVRGLISGEVLAGVKLDYEYYNGHNREGKQSNTWTGGYAFPGRGCMKMHVCMTRDSLFCFGGSTDEEFHVCGMFKFACLLVCL